MQRIKQAVILAGGQGTRLRPLTLTTPKPLILINGKPFLQYVLENLKENGIEEVVLLTGYMGEKIEEYFKNGEKIGITITYSSSPTEYDTGARIREAYEKLDSTFLLLYCDNYWPLKITELTKFYNRIGTNALVTCYSNEDKYTRNNMYINEKGIVTIYDKSRENHDLNVVDIGYFILRKELLNNLPEDNFSFEKTIIPMLIKQKQLAGFVTHHKYYGLSNLERIPLLEKYFTKRKVILLDRDGVINQKPLKGNYVKKVDEFIFLPGAILGLQKLQSEGYDIYIITNQAGVAKGIIKKTELEKIHQKLLEITKKKGVEIKGIYYCPHDWNDGCVCRKPKAGMLFKAAAEHKFDLTKAIFVGDDIRDQQAGKEAGCKTILMSENGSLSNVIRPILK